MRDIDFLAAQPAFSGTLVYRYRSGILRDEVRAALRKIAGKEGRTLSGCGRDEILVALGGGFFADMYWCDWTALNPSSALRRKLDAILSRITEMAGDRFAFFVPIGSPLLSHPLWPAVERSAGLVLEEEFVTRETLGPALRQFQASSDLATGVDWLADPAFEASFDSFSRRPHRTLLDLRHAFDDRVCACTDPITHAFLPEVYRTLHSAESRSRAASALRDLRTLLARQRDWDRFGLVRTLDERRTSLGWTARGVIGELHRVTRQILSERDRTDARREAAGSIRTSDLVLWTGLLLAWDGRLRAILADDTAKYRRRPDSLITALDGLGRDFLARADFEANSDHLGGAWEGVDGALSRVATHPTDALASSRAATVEALGKRLRRATRHQPWLIRLERRVRRAIDEANVAEAQRRDDRITKERAEQDAEAEKKRTRSEQTKIVQAPAGTKGGRRHAAV